MSEGPLHFTLRRLQTPLVSPRFWGLILTAGAITGLIGPFGTFDAMRFLPRLAYWLATVFITAMVGYTVVGLMFNYALGRVGPKPLRLALAGLIGGIPIAVVISVINTLLFDDPGMRPGALLTIAVETCLITAAISFLFGLVDVGGQVAAPGAAAEPGPELPRRPRILDRLPPKIRGRLSRLSVQDHYVDVRTDNGGTLVLMRLADAIAETEGVPGLQIHRSHWVALDAVDKAVRRDGKLLLRLSDGTELPVSRTYLAAVREAGLAQ